MGRGLAGDLLSRDNLHDWRPFFDGLLLGDNGGLERLWHLYPVDYELLVKVFYQLGDTLGKGHANEVFAPAFAGSFIFRIFR